MIFVTVGGNTPFDRLIRCVDQWAGERGRTDLLAQVGGGSYLPENMEWQRNLTPHDFRDALQRADCVVAHAGMGTVLSALQLGAPLLVMPRRADLHETRNDHQGATARHLKERGLVSVAEDETQLVQALDTLSEIQGTARIGPYASDELLGRLRSFIAGDRRG